MNEKDLKMWLIGFLTKYGTDAEKLNKDSDMILTFIKQHFNLKEKSEPLAKEYNPHIQETNIPKTESGNIAPDIKSAMDKIYSGDAPT